ncbi:hypothetical protein Tco_0612493 [Tanacetum coccineum]|uniref:Uncharacterized protein n=1 Tax=Tanacetum coccineum TaxID=301880 RepID=A0ABQ5BUF3_9ASTR
MIGWPKRDNIQMLEDMFAKPLRDDLWRQDTPFESLNGRKVGSRVYDGVRLENSQQTHGLRNDNRKTTKRLRKQIKKSVVDMLVPFQKATPTMTEEE